MPFFAIRRSAASSRRCRVSRLRRAPRASRSGAGSAVGMVDLTFLEGRLPLEEEVGIAIPVVQETRVYCITSYMTNRSVMITSNVETKMGPDGLSGLAPSAAQGEEAELLAYLNERL